ncbi:hypothetical protein [Spirochaeta cellobiosiphila]|uniref:hypothetical protein n=1 Tax=Spirochaeta cellobiosiphila TaxID=504483 RepID=UPI0004160DF1|nr:hypothetical protein [Spirochaeta cellobiosiphila]
MTNYINDITNEVVKGILSYFKEELPEELNNLSLIDCKSYSLNTFESNDDNDLPAMAIASGEVHHGVSEQENKIYIDIILPNSENKNIYLYQKALVKTLTKDHHLGGVVIDCKDITVEPIPFSAKSKGKPVVLMDFTTEASREG